MDVNYVILVAIILNDIVVHACVNYYAWVDC